MRTGQRHRRLAPAFGLPPRGVCSPLLGLVLALALSCPAVAQDADILVQPHEWEGGGREYTLVAVPEPYFEGREPAMQQVLRSVRKDLVALVEQPGVETGEFGEAPLRS